MVVDTCLRYPCVSLAAVARHCGKQQNEQVTQQTANNVVCWLFLRQYTDSFMCGRVTSMVVSKILIKCFQCCCNHHYSSVWELTGAKSVVMCCVRAPNADDRPILAPSVTTPSLNAHMAVGTRVLIGIHYHDIQQVNSYVCTVRSPSAVQDSEKFITIFAMFCLHTIFTVGQNFDCSDKFDCDSVQFCAIFSLAVN